MFRRFKNWLKLADIGRKRTLLKHYGWYRNLYGGWTHGHMLDYMEPVEIARLTPAQLEYKLQHGSMAILPNELKGEMT